MRKLTELTILISIFLLSGICYAVPARPILHEFQQPDNTTFKGYLRGDENGYWYETETGYAIQKTGEWWTYVTQNELLNQSVDLRVGHVSPQSIGIHKSIFKAIDSSKLSIESDIPVPTTRRASMEDQPQYAPPPTGTHKVVVILIQFTNQAHDPSHDTAYFQNLLFNASNPLSLTSYYNEVSYGKLNLTGTVLGWYTSSHPVEYYATDGYGYIDTGQPGPNWPVYIYELTREAILLANPNVNFADYDTDSDGYADHVIIIHSGHGQEEGYPPDTSIWSHSWVIPGGQLVDGKRVYLYTMDPEYGKTGVFAHEFGHDLGLPDLYNTYSGDWVVDTWDLMDGGSWGGPSYDGTVPTHMSAWCKIDLGWLKATQLTGNPISYYVKNLENKSQAFIINNSILNVDKEYYIVENREKVGFDAYIPGEGTVIWHIDNWYIYGHVPCSRTNNTINACVQKGIVPEYVLDVTDAAYSSNAAKQYFNDTTTPSSIDNWGNNTQVSVFVNSAKGLSMRVHFFGDDVVPPVLTSVKIKSNNSDSSKAKVGNSINLSSTADKALSNNPVVKIAGHTASVSSTGGNSYTATYTMAPGDSEGTVNFTIDFISHSYISGVRVTSTTDSSSVIFDKTPPSTSASLVESDGSNYTENTWTNSSYVNVTLLCTDATSGCAITHYCIDTSNLCTPTISTESGLVGLWNLNEGTGTTANDSSGNGNTGTIIGASWTSGRIGNALSFNGSSYVNVGNATILRNFTAMTISVWINPAQLNYASAKAIVARANSVAGQRSYQIVQDTANKFCFMTRNISDAVWATSCIDSAITATNSWYHIVGVWNGTHIYTYLNGILQTNNIVAFSNLQSSITTTYIGRNTASGTLFNGTIDDVKIFNRALSATEIANMYNYSLLGYWNLNEGTGTTANDSSGNGNTGTISGATWTGGKYGNALRFNGLSTNNVYCGNSTILRDFTAMTISLWFKTSNTSLTSARTILSRWNAAAGQRSYAINQNTGNTISFTLRKSDDSATISATSTATIDTNWHHIAAVWNGTHAIIYIDGVQSGSPQAISAIRPSIAKFYIGRQQGGSVIYGTIDDVKIYGTALTSQQIADISNLRAYWNLNEGTGTTANDSSGNGNTGTISGATWTGGKYGPALSFDGKNDLVNITNSSLFNFGSGNFSICAWVYPTNLPQDSSTTFVIFAKTNSTSIGESYSIQLMNTSGNYVTRFHVRDMYGYAIDLRGNSVTNNVWLHVCGVRDGNNFSLWENGAYVTSNSLALGGVASLIYTPYIGCARGNSGWFNGTIDEVKIFNRALSATEINDSYKGLIKIYVSTKGTSYITYNSTDNVGNSEAVNSKTIKIY
ncbi:MAG: M6 family metalloprotease domain-containing protein [Candidatus Micrarchaeota archaeon]|nr:M6 family metalloprotease domain-containing protein [Candidatus Micrarchaeota archaeon]